MRILHVSYSRAGGIGNVVSELVKSQTLDGHEVDWGYITSGPLRSDFPHHPLETLRAGLDEFVLRHQEFYGPISSLRTGGSLMRLVASKMQDYEVVHVHGGALDLRIIAGLETSARVVVTHHDMRLITGACHQSIGCKQYRGSCSSCPALRSPFKYRAEQQMMTSFPTHWRHTAPSKHFASRLTESSLLTGKHVTVVPNPLPAELISYQPAGNNDEFLTIIGSSSYSRLRNLPADHLKLLSKEAQRSGLKLVSLGGNEYDSTLVENFGVLNRSDSFDIMSRSRVCVTPTRFESFSTIGLEAIYLGASLIAPLDSPQGELAEELHLRIDMGKPGLDSMKPPSRKDTQVKLARKFGIKQIKQAIEDVYVDA